jgi:hypothetical protein
MVRHHVPELVQGLKGQAHVIALATADHDFAGRKAKRYVRHYDQIRNPNIRSFRTSDALRDGAFTNYMEFAGKAGVELFRAPPDQPD